MFSWEAVTDAVNLELQLAQVGGVDQYRASLPSGLRLRSTGLNFADLRAIPFVGSWSQLKQNVPGFFGVGTALKHFEETNQWEKVQLLYDNSLFFRTLLENSMMSLAKS